MFKAGIAGVLFWALLLGGFILVRPASRLHQVTCENAGKRQKLIIVASAILLIAVMAVTMSLSPTWNGADPDYVDQYERITESFLHGHLYFEYDDVDPKLLEMENPYDFQARTDGEVWYHWDHAFYNGHYYMYFGVVPVFLLFMPFRLLTGTALTTYHATQIFVAGFTLGFFALSWKLTKRFFKNLPVSIYLSLALILSLACARYSVKHPAMYHTAISAGFCMEVWSFYFFIKAVWFAESEKKAITAATIGALFGALAFGCRPSLAMGNLAAIPMFLVFLKEHRHSPRFFVRLLWIALPYIVVAIALMVYNKARFDNPFEFGQSYPLTSADLSNYGGSISQLNLVNVLNGLIHCFVESPKLSESFPYLGHGGVFWECPVLLLLGSGFFHHNTKAKLRETGLSGFWYGLIVTALIIVVIQTEWSPILMPRYCEDYMWLLAICAFLTAGIRCTVAENSSYYASLVCRLALVSAFVIFMVTLIPEDGSFTETRTELMGLIRGVLRLGIPLPG